MIDRSTSVWLPSLKTIATVLALHFCICTVLSTLLLNLKSKIPAPIMIPPTSSYHQTAADQPT